MHAQSPGGKPTDITRCSSAAWPSSTFRRRGHWSFLEEISGRGLSASRAVPDANAAGDRTLLTRFADMLTTCIQMFPYRQPPAAIAIVEEKATDRGIDHLLPAAVSVQSDDSAARTIPRGDDPASPVSPIIRAQTELVGTMLKAMIVASGGNVDAPPSQAPERVAPRRWWRRSKS